jgi:anti-sigma factor RsiW
MSKDPLYEQMREISWRRKLTPTEEAELSKFLATHPEAQADWEAESGLNQALQGLPNVGVANNFTARVVAEAKRQAAFGQRAPAGSQGAWQWCLKWLPKAALAAVLLGAGLLSYHHVQDTKRAEWAESLAAVSQVPSLPSPEILKDFDAIAALGSTPPADVELLKVMQ